MRSFGRGPILRLSRTFCLNNSMQCKDPPRSNQMPPTFFLVHGCPRKQIRTAVDTQRVALVCFFASLLWAGKAVCVI